MSKGSESETGGEGETDAFAPPSAKTAAPPHIDLLSKSSSYVKDAEFDIQVHGQPNSKVAMYLTDYFQAKVAHNVHFDVHLDPTGVGFCRVSIPIETEPGHHAVHLRASPAPGVFSNLVVSEYESLIYTKGGGV